MAPEPYGIVLGFANVKSLGKEPSIAGGPANGWLCGRPAILRKQFAAKGYLLVGIVESRCRDAVAFSRDGFFVVSSSANQHGSYGMQLWVSLRQPGP